MSEPKGIARQIVSDYFTPFQVLLVNAVTKAIMLERERCAQIASKYRNSYGGEHADYWDGQTNAAEAIADEIRGLP